MQPLGTGGINIDATKVNIFRIDLGFGAIKFYIEDPATGDFVKFHQIDYANENINPSLENPALFLFVSADNGTTTDDLIVETSSMMWEVQGKKVLGGPLRGTEETNTSVGSSIEPIFSVKVLEDFAGGSGNQFSSINAHSIGYAIEADKTGFIYLIEGGVLSGGSWEFVEENVSIAQVRKPNSITGGRIRYIITFSQKSADLIELNGRIEQALSLGPGETWTVAGKVIGADSEISASLNWSEDI